MSTTFLLLLALAHSPLSAWSATHPGDEVTRINRPAPSHGIESLRLPASDNLTKVFKATGTSLDEALSNLTNLTYVTQGKPITIESMHGKVLMMHTMALDSQACLEETLPLLRDLLQANADRDLTAITILPHPSESAPATGDEDDEGSVALAEKRAGVLREELKEHAKRLGLEHPLVYAPASGCPYYDTDANGINFITLIGRSGEIAWRGNPVKEQKAFLKALKVELDEAAAPRLRVELSADLDQVLDDYYTGAWGAARNRAEKLLKRLAKARDPQARSTREDLSHVIDKVSAAEREHLAAMRTALGKRRSDTFYTERGILLRAFPKGQTEKVVKDMGKNSKRDLFSSSFLDAERYHEFVYERPVFFPARKTRAGDKFARKLEKLLKKTSNSVRATQKAAALLDAYRVVR